MKARVIKDKNVMASIENQKELTSMEHQSKPFISLKKTESADVDDYDFPHETILRKRWNSYIIKEMNHFVVKFSDFYKESYIISCDTINTSSSVTYVLNIKPAKIYDEHYFDFVKIELNISRISFSYNEKDNCVLLTYYGDHNHIKFVEIKSLHSELKSEVESARFLNFLETIS